MAKANLFMVIMIILSINVVLYTAGVRVVESDSVMGQFIDTDVYDSNQVVNVNQDFKDTIPTTYQESGGGSVFSFIDTFRAAINFVKFIVNIVFTPIGLFVELPGPVGLMVGFPLLVAGVIGLIYFIRSGA